MKRSFWQETMTEISCPAWQCPVCNNGVLALVPKSLKYEETAASKRAHSHEDWEPEWLDYTFVAWAECKHPSCKQRFALAGIGGVEPQHDDEYSFVLADYFAPRYCHPMPRLIELPAKCPDRVRDELLASFALFWGDATACAGRLRIALEELMTYLGMQSLSRQTKPQSKPRLHAAIESFAKNNPVLGAQLMALKWLGNTGSHDSSVSQSDLLDAFEILEHALSEILERRSERVALLAKQLTDKHAMKKTP